MQLCFNIQGTKDNCVCTGVMNVIIKTHRKNNSPSIIIVLLVCYYFINSIYYIESSNNYSLFLRHQDRNDIILSGSYITKKNHN